MFRGTRTAGESYDRVSEFEGIGADRALDGAAAAARLRRLVLRDIPPQGLK